MSSLLRGPSAADGMITASVRGVLLSVSAVASWPDLSFADAFASATILDWVGGSRGLIFLLRHRLGTTDGG